MNIVTIDEMDERDFRFSIEDMLRLDQVDAAVERLRGLMEPHVGVHETLPPRFLEVTSRDVEFGGWHRLADRLLDHDRPNHKVSAIGVTLADARVLGGPGPARGKLAPFIKTFYFNDDAYPFSDATRDDLLDGYSRDGFEWQGDYQATDATLSIRGIDDLYGAIVELEDRLLDSPDPAEDEIRAGTIGACYLAALIHQSLRDTIREKGLPRPLCVLAACDGIYPFFDAPVAGCDECAAQQASEAIADEQSFDEEREEPAQDADEPADEPAGMASLLSMVSHRVAKAPVMVLCEEDAEEAARYAEIAEAERIGVEDGHALNVALAEAQAANLFEAAAMAAEPLWSDDELLDAGAEPEHLMVPSDDAWSGYGDAFADETHHDPERDFELAEPDEEVLPIDADRVDGLYAAPASHSLRARLNMQALEPQETRQRGFDAFLNWIRRTIFRR